MDTSRKWGMMGAGKATPAYYFDQTSGNDSNDGLTPAAAFKTVAKFNSLATNPTYQRLFKKGETWKESMVMPANGLTIGTYGTGNAPVFNGTDTIATWTPESLTSNVNMGDSTTASAYDTDGADCILWVPVTISLTGTLQSIGVYIGANASAHTKVALYTYDGISRPGTLVANTTSAEKAQTLNAWNVYIITGTPTITAGAYYLAIHTNADINVMNSGGALTCILKSVSYASGFPATYTESYWTSSRSGGFYAVIHTSVSGGYSKALAIQPQALWFDGVIGQHKSSITNLNNKDWYWAANVLHIISTSDPAVIAITGTQRNFGVEITDKSNITINGLHFIGMGMEGIIAYNSASTGLKVLNCEIDHCGNGITIGQSYARITHNNIHDLDHMAVETGANTDYGACGMVLVASNCEVAYNSFTNCVCPSQAFTHDGGFVELYPGGTLTGISVHHNIVANCDDLVEVSGTITNTTFDYNIVINTIGSKLISLHNSGITYSAFGIYNNVFYMVAPAPVGLQSSFAAANAGTGFILKNNIFYSINYTAIFDHTDFAHTYNDYYGGYGGLTLGTGEITGDPTFVTNGSDFHLQVGSPCIKAGINVGLTTDYDGVAVANPPCIGAYEHA